MQRSSFIKMCMAAGAVLTAPFESFAKRNQHNRNNKPFKVDAGKDRFDKPITLFEGDTFYTKVSTSDTDSDLYIYESSRVKKGGPALHLHYSQDEWWYVLEGEFLIKVGMSFTMQRRETVYLAREGFHMLLPKQATAMPGC